MGELPLILCIDDDRDSLKLRATLLESLGYRVTSVADPQQALRLFRSRPVDAVVMDYQMPQMNGGEVATEMKRLRPEVPVLIVSALEQLPEDAPRGAIDAFVSKREPLAVLAAALERILTEEEAPADSPGSAQRIAELVRPRRLKTVRAAS